jgi:hypothetical protein
MYILMGVSMGTYASFPGGIWPCYLRGKIREGKREKAKM